MAKQLEKHATNILDFEKAKELGDEFEISTEYLQRANGNIIILLLCDLMSAEAAFFGTGL